MTKPDAWSSSRAAGIELQTDTTIKKVQSGHSPLGRMGQKHLASGKRLSMRLWERMPKGEAKSPYAHVFETIGYVIAGRERLKLEDEAHLEPGDCWLVPPGATYRYHIKETFTAVEATSPPAEFHGA